MKLYRYDSINGYGYMKVCLEEYEVERETPCGYWIRGERKWVPKDGKKRYAYPTKEEALESFRARKRRQIGILRKQLANAEVFLNMTFEEKKGDMFYRSYPVFEKNW